MAFDITTTPGTAGLPNITVPSFSQAQLRGATDQAQTVLSSIAEKTARSVGNGIQAASDSLGSVAARVATPILEKLGESQQTLDGLRGLARDHALGSMAAANALLATSGQQTVALGEPVTASATAPVSPSLRTPATPAGQPVSPGVRTGVPPGKVTNVLPGSFIRVHADLSHEVVTGLPPVGTKPVSWYPAGADVVNAQNGFVVQSLSQWVPVYGQETLTWSIYIGYDGCVYLIWMEGVGQTYDIPGEQIIRNFTAQPGAAATAAYGVAQNLDSQNLKCGQATPPPVNPCPAGQTCQGPCPVCPVCPPPTGSCPPVTVNVPPCPTPPPCPPVTFPTCLMIDLCDWKKLCDTLTNCLKQAASSGECALDNETAYVYSDCTGGYGGAQYDYWLPVAKSFLSATDVLSALAPEFPGGQAVAHTPGFISSRLRALKATV